MMPIFDVRIGRDATVYHTTKIEADSKADIENKIHKSWIDVPEDTVWTFDGYSEFDNIESVKITRSKTKEQ